MLHGNRFSPSHRASLLWGRLPVLAILASIGGAAQAQQFWDGAGAVADGQVLGGIAIPADGTWDTLGTNWTTATGDANGPWANLTAIFQGTAFNPAVGGTVTVVGTQAFDTLRFLNTALPGNGPTYTLTGGALAAPGRAAIDVASQTNTTIASTLTAAGLDKQGTGRLILSGAGNLLTDTLGVQAGTLVLSSDLTTTGTTTIAAGATLETGTGLARLLRAGGGTPVIVVDGTLLLNGNNTLPVHRYEMSGVGVVSLGGVTLDGTSTHAGGTQTSAFGHAALLSPAALGSGALRIFGGRLDLMSVMTIANPIELAIGPGRITSGVPTTEANPQVLAGVISGDQGLALEGAVRLTASNTFTGPLEVRGITMLEGGLAAGGSTRVVNGGMLRGLGNAAGSLSVQSGGILAPGNLATRGALSAGSVSLEAGSAMNFRLAAPGGANDRLVVAGNFGVTGPATVNIANASGFNAGTYTLVAYGGAGSGLGSLALGALPAGFTSVLDTATLGQVNLQVSLARLFWDGANTTPGSVADGRGGTATWDGAATNWTNQIGLTNGAWVGGSGVFAGTAGTVTVSGTQPFADLEFRTDGYAITGDPLAFTAGGQLRPQPGIGATIASALEGTGGLTIGDGGTMRLRGVNTYTGGTVVTGGATLDIADATNLAAGTLTLNGGTLRTSTTDVPFFGQVVVANPIVLGASGGTLTTGGAPRFPRLAVGDISGAGRLTIATAPGAGVTLLGTASHTGSTEITANSGLALGNGIANGNITGLVQIDAGASLAVLPGSDMILDAQFTGNGGLLVSADAGVTVTLARPSGLTGGLTLGGTGTVVVDGANRLGSGEIIAQSGGPPVLRTTQNMQINNLLRLQGGSGGSARLGLAPDAGTTAVLATGLAGDGGTLFVMGAGTVRMDANSVGQQNIVVRSGTYELQGSAQGGLEVEAGGTLRGTGRNFNAVSIAGTVSPGTEEDVGTLRLGNLAMQPGSIANFRLSAPGDDQDLIRVLPVGAATGDLTLTAPNSSTVNVIDFGGFGAGIYTLITYAGTGTQLDGFQLGSTPTGYTVTLNTLTPGEVRLQATALPAPPANVPYWDGGNLAAGNVAAGRGGNGVWNSASTNWTTAAGSSNDAWGAGLGVFAGAAGSVAVVGTQSFDTLRFVTDGYVINDGALAATGNGIIQVDANVTATINSPITGGTLAKTSDGVLVLGAGGRFGNLNIDAGTLRVASRETATGQGIIRMANATFDAPQGFSNPNAFLMTGAARFTSGREEAITLASTSGPGSLTVAAGTVRIAGPAAHSGGTGIDAGAVMAIGDGGALAGGVVNNGELQLDRSDNLGFGNPVSGAGRVVLTGTGTVALTGRNSFSGGIEVRNGGSLRVADLAGLGTGGIRLDNGGLVAGGAMTLPQAIDIAAGGGRITPAGGTVLALAGALGGTGPLAFSGGGEVALTGGGTLSGPVTVEGGTLRVNGAGLPNAPVTVQPGATLAGNATIGALALQAGGLVSPGNSIGTVNVTGNAVLAPGSVYVVETHPNGSADRVAVTGTATVTGGQVRVQAGNFGTGYPATSTYTILTAGGGVIGTFAGATTDLAFFTPSLLHNPNDVQLVLARNSRAFPDVALTFNQRAVAGTLAALPAGDRLPSAVLALTAEQARQSFDSLSGEIHASSLSARLEESRLVRHTVLARARQPGRDAVTAEAGALRLGAWFQGFGETSQTASDGNAASLQRQTRGGVAGIDAGDAAGSWRLGAFYAHTDNTYRVSARTGSRAEADTSYFGLYGMARLGDFRLSGGAALLTGSQDTTRGAEPLLGLSGAMRGSYDLDGAQAFMEAAYAMRVGRFAVEPFAGLAWTRVGAGRVAETGVAASNLTGGARSAEQLWSTLGLRVETSLTLGGGMVLTPRAEIGWQHAYGRTAPLTTLAFASGGNPFTIAGAPMARDAIVGELGADLRITENLRGMVSYLGATGSGVDQHAIRLGLALTF